MMQLDSIEVTGKTATLCFVNKFSQKKIYRNMTIIEHVGEMILFSKDERYYLFDGESIQDAEEITLHDKHKRCYTLKDKERFILFCGGKQIFEISGADIKGIIPISGDRFIVEYTHKLHVYKDQKQYAVFTKMQNNKEAQDG